ncbi:MAG TPA: group I intron-associated PD-(D/E)XK endonuclease [Terriglobales bacterium]|nr:group I intron-associated PD-(D/E)XK endonuclease [Terriglobales bacterium]
MKKRLRVRGTRFDGDKLSPKRRGELAEAAFLEKVVSLGFQVSKPWGESGPYDFVLDSGRRMWRVQVKSAHCNGKNGYTVHAHGNNREATYSIADIDVLVAYVAPEEVWYVVPVEVFLEIKSMKLFPASKRRRSKFEVYREAWGLMRRKGK